MTKEVFLNTINQPVKNKAIQYNVLFLYDFLRGQIALETGWGSSSLFYEHYNVGGIKAYGTVAQTLQWTWEHVLTVNLDHYPNRDATKDKVLNELETAIYLQLPFASFDNLEDGIDYYFKYVLMNSYFKHYIDECGQDPFKYVQLLQSGGDNGKHPKYATDINYVAKITSLINQFKNM